MDSQQITALAADLGGKLLAKQLKVTVAESCTAGSIAEAITRIPGSSCWFEMGFVTYSNRAKSKLLGVEESLLVNAGAVSQGVVEQMALGALEESQANLAASVSGIAGPDGGTEEKPIGTVWFAWAKDSGEIVSAKHQFCGDRQAVREQSVVTALQGLIDLV